MNANAQSEKLSDLNRRILEIKKKIQLSEGQRKALFEDCEDERKTNCDDILKLKKEISHLTISLYENANVSAQYRIKRQNKILEQIIGPLDDKTCDQVKELLDLQIIDKSKHIDILRFQIKKRKKKLADLGKQYKALNTQVDKKILKVRVDLPVKKSTCELQNNIHAVELQIREATHVKKKYLDIRKSLKDDASKFESNIIKLNEEISTQARDIEKLHKILDEAIKMKTAARTRLLQEEKVVAAFASSREKELSEGRKLVNDKKQELEKLEKKIFQGNKVVARPEPEGAEEDKDDERPETPPHPCEALAQDFEVLKKATGGISIEEVLDRFKTQKDTNERLMVLRKKSENEKRKLEKRKDSLETQLEGFRYAEVKDAERKSNEIEKLQNLIENEIERIKEYKQQVAGKEDGIKMVICGLRSMYLCIKPVRAPKEDENPLVILEKIKVYVQDIMQKMEQINISPNLENASNMLYDVNDDKWLPTPYTSLVRRTPLPQPGTSPAPAPPPPPGSEDEDEVPSRAYLKRQAQLVVDAKTRRKTLKIRN